MEALNIKKQVRNSFFIDNCIHLKWLLKGLFSKIKKFIHKHHQNWFLSDTESG